MQTEIKQVSPVEYELEVHASADDIEPELNQALRRQRSQTDMKGFRKGKVPLTLVKKMHGEALGYGVAEQMVQDAFEGEVEDGSDLEVLGQPQLTQLDYELDGDLHAVIRFGVRPEIELKDLSDEQISRLAHEITDEDVEEEIDNMRTKQADLIPVDEDDEAGPEDYVMVDLQRIDPSTNTPVIGDKEEDLSFFLDDERLKEELRDALIGKTAGTTFRVDLPHEPGPQADDEPEMRVYEVELKDVKRRELPAVDEEFVRAVTEEEFEDPDIFRKEIRHQLENAWEKQSREMLQGAIIERMLDLHSVPVPQSVVETYLDSFVEQVKQRNDGELPDDFDMELFRKNQEGEAERQGRWMLIRDAFIEQEGIEVDEDDLMTFFEEQGDDEVSAQQLQQFYRSMPKLMERVKQQLLSQKVFDTLMEQFDIEDKTREEYEEEMEAAHHHAHDDAHPPAGAPEEAPAGESTIITE